MTTLEEVRDELKALGFRAVIINAEYERDAATVPGLNVWLGDQNARYPDDTVWPPVGSDGWVWGDRFQHTLPADTAAKDIADRITETVRTRS